MTHSQHKYGNEKSHKPLFNILLRENYHVLAGRFLLEETLNWSDIHSKRMPYIEKIPASLEWFFSSTAKENPCDACK